MTSLDLTLSAANDLELDQLVMMLEASIAAYKKDPCDRTRHTMENCCHLMLYKAVITERGFDKARAHLNSIVKTRSTIEMQKPRNG